MRNVLSKINNKFIWGRKSKDNWTSYGSKMPRDASAKWSRHCPTVSLSIGLLSFHSVIFVFVEQCNVQLSPVSILINIKCRWRLCINAAKDVGISHSDRVVKSQSYLLQDVSFCEMLSLSDVHDFQCTRIYTAPAPRVRCSYDPEWVSAFCTRTTMFRWVSLSSSQA